MDDSGQDNAQAVPNEGAIPSEEAPPPMDIHKPKPIHSLKELASEIGVIVIGILIALGLEQGIETIHAREQVAAASKAIDAELHRGMLEGVSVTNMVDCTDRQLAALSDAIGRGDQPKVRKLLGSAVFPWPGAWSDSAWQTAVASDVTTRFTDMQQAAYPVLYTFLDAERGKRDRYVNAYGRLRALALTGLSVSPDATRAELSEMAEMTAALRDLQVLAQALPENARFLHMEITQAEYDVRPFKAQEALCKTAAAALGPSPAA